MKKSRIPRKVRSCPYCGHKARKVKNAWGTYEWEIHHADGCFLGLVDSYWTQIRCDDVGTLRAWNKRSKLV